MTSSDLMPRDTAASAQPSPTVRIVSLRVRGAERRRLQEAARSGKLAQVASSDVLAEAALPRLAMQSLWLLVISAATYALLIGAARQWGHAGPLLGDGPLWLRITLLLTINIVGYVLMIPAHEAMHALVILALGGRPRFGLKLPLAAYCTAPDQLFLRDGYLVVALAPLLALSGAAVVVAALAPNIAALLLLAFAGNVSGAIGDLEVVRDISKHPSDTLIADTATGYIAYHVEKR